MANLNTGTPRRQINGGVVQLGASSGALDTILLVEEGSLEFTDPGRSIINVMAGSNLGHQIEGDKRPITGRLSIKMAAAGYQGSASVWDAFQQAFSAGAATPKVMRITIPDGVGGSTGNRITFSAVTFPNGTSWKQGTDMPDTITVEFMSFESGVDWTSY